MLAGCLFFFPEDNTTAFQEMVLDFLSAWHLFSGTVRHQHKGMQENSSPGMESHSPARLEIICPEQSAGMLEALPLIELAKRYHNRQAVQTVCRLVSYKPCPYLKTLLNDTADLSILYYTHLFLYIISIQRTCGHDLEIVLNLENLGLWCRRHFVSRNYCNLSQAYPEA